MDFQGTWTPLGRATAHPAILRVDSNRVEILWDGATDAITIPRTDVVLTTPIGKTNRRLRVPNYGQFEMADSPMLRDAFPEAHRGFEHWVDWIERRKMAILAGVVITASSVLAFLFFGVPYLADRIARHMPHSLEVQVSDQTMSLLNAIALKPTKVPKDQQDRLRKQFDAMVAGEPRADQMKLGFASAPNVGPNAFALPDGRLTVTDELLTAVKGDDAQVLAVLAHEAGHHVHYHGMRSSLEDLGIVGVLSFFLGDVTGTSVLAALPPALMRSRFSRGHETEADDYAFMLLRKRSISPAKFADALTAIIGYRKPSETASDTAEDEIGREIEENLSFLSSHPAPQERIRRAREAAE